jgi:hypothetical protein
MSVTLYALALPAAVFNSGTGRLWPRYAATGWREISMKIIARLERSQLEALAFASLLALLWVISSLFNVAAGVDRDLSAMAPNQVTTLALEARHH